MAGPNESDLTHYGVKGMKWGVRRKSSDVRLSTKDGTKVRAKGGAKYPATDEAKRVATSKQKAKKSSTDSLTTKEFQEMVNRMNLEQQYARLKPSKFSRGKKAVAGVLAAGATVNSVIAFTKSPAGQILQKKFLG